MTMKITFTDKLKCFLGIHQMQPVQYLLVDKKRNSSFLKYTRECNCCGRTDTFIESKNAWDGRQKIVANLGYVGDYSWYTFVRMVLRRFK